MTNEEQDSQLAKLPICGTLIMSFPWLEIIGELWKFGRKIFRGFSNEGIYEVLDYETTLELQDRKGNKARLKKREKVRYLQDHILAHQDQAWGDGKILLNYRCAPGVPVDRYRSGYKTNILISLREVKNKGDIDEFNIEWGIKNGFLSQTGFWSTEISQRTKRIIVQAIFPRSRPPSVSWMIEKNIQRTHLLDGDTKKKLSDGRWMINWEKKNPRLYEHYILKWEW
jgi:hypothetical protein